MIHAASAFESLEAHSGKGKMGIITPKSFAEGDLTSTTDLTSSDSAWSGLHGDVDGMNIRSEGLDRRVIKQVAWAENSEVNGNQNYYLSTEKDLSFPTSSGVTASNPIFINLTDGFYGVSSGSKPEIEATWERGKTQAMMVRASFYIRWKCGAMQTNSDGLDIISTGSA